MSKALLICNSPETGPWLKKLARQVDFVLAADGGADRALSAGVIPNAVIGDLDSVSPRTQRTLKEIPFIHINRQDNTDLEKALDWLTTQKFDSCIIAGATGGRLDFTFGNILSLRPYLNKMDMCLRGKNWTLLPLTQTRRLTARKGARCSLIPLTPCKNVTLKGFKYGVKQEDWDTKHIGRTLSNEIAAATAEISFTRGLLLVYLED